METVKKTLERRQRMAAIKQMRATGAPRRPVRLAKESLESLLHRIAVSPVTTLFVCPSKGSACGIAEYTAGVQRELGKKGVRAMTVETVEDACAIACQVKSISHILVQHEYSFFDSDPTNPQTGYLTRGETSAGAARAIERMSVEVDHPVRVSLLLHSVTGENQAFHQPFVGHPNINLYATTPDGARQVGYADCLPLGCYSAPSYKPSPSAPPPPGEPWRIGNFGMAGNHRAIRSQIDVCAATDSILIGSFWCRNDPRIAAHLIQTLRASEVSFSVETDFADERELIRRLSPAHIFYMPRAEAQEGHSYSSASAVLATIFEKPLILTRVRCYSNLFDAAIIVDSDADVLDVLDDLRDPVRYEKECQRVRDWRAACNVADLWIAANTVG